MFVIRWVVGGLPSGGEGERPPTGGAGRPPLRRPRIRPGSRGRVQTNRALTVRRTWHTFPPLSTLPPVHSGDVHAPHPLAVIMTLLRAYPITIAAPQTPGRLARLWLLAAAVVMLPGTVLGQTAGSPFDMGHGDGLTASDPRWPVAPITLAAIADSGTHEGLESPFRNVYEGFEQLGGREVTLDEPGGTVARSGGFQSPRRRETSKRGAWKPPPRATVPPGSSRVTSRPPRCSKPS